MGGLLSKWTDGEREAPAPLEGPVNGTVIAGTVLWFLLFVGQLPFYGWFEDRGHTWWIWTCAAGTGLGLFGLWYIRHREAVSRRAVDRGPEHPATPADDAASHRHPAPDPGAQLEGRGISREGDPLGPRPRRPGTGSPPADRH